MIWKELQLVILTFFPLEPGSAVIARDAWDSVRAWSARGTPGAEWPPLAHQPPVPLVPLEAGVAPVPLVPRVTPGPRGSRRPLQPLLPPALGHPVPHPWLRSKVATGVLIL